MSLAGGGEGDRGGFCVCEEEEVGTLEDGGWEVGVGERVTTAEVDVVLDEADGGGLVVRAIKIISYR